MMEGNNPRGLDLVYAAKDPAELARAYAVWAAEYDRETIALGYCLPFVITGWVARYAARDAAVLDVGCGTGLSGPILEAQGYTDLSGLDMSVEMLDLARARDAYRELTRGDLGARLPFDDASFDLCFASGVFTAGHAPASGFREIARVTRPGGHVIATVRDILIEPNGFRTVFDELRDAGTWEAVEESEPFRAFVLAEEDVKVKCVVFRRL